MAHILPPFATDAQAREGLRARAAAGKAWLTQAALPLWSTSGFDQTARCFYEKLDLSGRPAPGPRRVRVQARQTAVFAIAGRRGWSGPWREMVEAGLAVLFGTAQRPDGGVRHLLDDAGAPLDSRRDLYDLAFVIFALAHAGRSLNRPDLFAAADAHVAWIEAHWRHPSGGFLEGEVKPIPPRRQNPHMHFFEALLALCEATGEAKHIARAGEIFTLFTTRLYDSARGAFPEFFDDDWRPAAGDEGRHAEPGHHFEWSWLLQRYSALTSTPLHEAAQRMCAFGETFGVDPKRGAARDEIWIDGAPKSERARLWPQTERIKANAALFARTGELAYANAAAGAFDALTAYLDTPVPGLWRDQWMADGAFIEEPAPASTFYHIFLALDEMARLFEGPA